MDDHRWSTENAHHDNVETMNDYLATINMLDIIFVDGTYAEGVNGNGQRYEIHAGGDGDQFNHIITFKLIQNLICSQNGCNTECATGGYIVCERHLNMKTFKIRSTHRDRAFNILRRLNVEHYENQHLHECYSDADKKYGRFQITVYSLDKDEQIADALFNIGAIWQK